MNAHIPDPRPGWASPGGTPPPAWEPTPPRASRRWPAIAAAAIIGAVLAATSAATIATRIATHHDSRRSHTPAVTVTVTAPPSTASPPVPLPPAEADRRTCDAWHAAGDLIHSALHAQAVIPEGITILDPAVKANPKWSAAVRQAADLYGQAGDTISAGIAPGTTAPLDRSAITAGAALHALSSAVAAFDPANGNMNSVVHESADAMDVLCDRLAPR